MSDGKPAPEPSPPRTRRRRIVWIAVTVAGLVASAGVGAMLVSITRHKTEAKTTFVRLVEVGEDDTDAAKWGTNWPLQYDGYKRTAIRTRSASRAMPAAAVSTARRVVSSIGCR